MSHMASKVCISPLTKVEVCICLPVTVSACQMEGSVVVDCASVSSEWANQLWVGLQEQLDRVSPKTMHLPECPFTQHAFPFNV